MIERIKRKFNSLYWHQFALTAGMVMLTLLLLGVSFFTLSYGTTTAEKRGEMRTRAELIAQVSADYLIAAGDENMHGTPPCGRRGAGWVNINLIDGKVKF